MGVTLDDLCEPWADHELPHLDRTRPPAPLTALQTRWRRDGFVVLPDLLDDQVLAAYEDEWLADNAARPGGWPHATPYMDHPALRRLALDHRIQAALDELIGHPMGLHLCLTGWRSTTRNWHQDGYLNPDTNRDHYAAVWVALDTIHRDAGPFQLVPGSHRGHLGVIRHDRMLAALDPDERGPLWPTHSERILTPLIEAEMERAGMAPLTYLPNRGDVLIWHARLLHRGSIPNDPDRERRAVILHYSSIDHRPDMPGAVAEHGGWYFPLGGSQPVR